MRPNKRPIAMKPSKFKIYGFVKDAVKSILNANKEVNIKSSSFLPIFLRAIRKILYIKKIEVNTIIGRIIPISARSLCHVSS